MFWSAILNRSVEITSLTVLLFDVAICSNRFL